MHWSLITLPFSGIKMLYVIHLKPNSFFGSLKIPVLALKIISMCSSRVFDEIDGKSEFHLNIKKICY